MLPLIKIQIGALVKKIARRRLSTKRPRQAFVTLSPGEMVSFRCELAGGTKLIWSADESRTFRSRLPFSVVIGQIN